MLVMFVIGFVVDCYVEASGWLAWCYKVIHHEDEATYTNTNTMYVYHEDEVTYVCVSFHPYHVCKAIIYVVLML